MAAADKLIKDASSFGRFYVTVGSVITTILGLLLAGFAIYLLTHKERTTIETTASIIDRYCVPYVSPSGESRIVMYDCQLTVSYNIDGLIYTSNIHTNSSINYRIGENIEIQYDPDDPTNIRLKTASNQTIGLILLGAAAFMIIITWIWWYIVKKYDFVSAASGFAGIFNIVK